MFNGGALYKTLTGGTGADTFQFTAAGVLRPILLQRPERTLPAPLPAGVIASALSGRAPGTLSIVPHYDLDFFGPAGGGDVLRFSPSFTLSAAFDTRAVASSTPPATRAPIC